MLWSIAPEEASNTYDYGASFEKVADSMRRIVARRPELYSAATRGMNHLQEMQERRAKQARHSYLCADSDSD